jgi:aminoglycoside phosphotransferase (APT) family kinase protein
MIEEFVGGQSNPTYLVQTGDTRLVLRCKPCGSLLPSAHAVDREFRVLRALAGTDVPTARPIALCDDPTVIGSAFYLMEYVAGRIFWNPQLPELGPSERSAVFADMNRVIAAIHRIDLDAVGLADYGRPGNYLSRQVAGWARQYHASGSEPIEAMDRIIEWLEVNLPPEAAPRLIHGDFRIDNLIFHQEEPRILAVIDWELSTLGDPVADFAYHMLPWHIDVSATAVRGLGGADLAALGIPDQSHYLALYCRHTRQPPPVNWHYYIVFGLFRVAAIVHGIAARARQGNAVHESAADFGRHARSLADLAWSKAQDMSR